MKNLLSQNRIYLAGVALAISVVWIGKHLKEQRAEKIQSMVREKVQSPTPVDHSPTAAVPGIKTSELNVISDTFNANGQRLVLLSEKTKAQLEAEKAKAEKVAAEVRKVIFAAELQAQKQTIESRQKRFQAAELKHRMKQIESLDGRSSMEKINSLVDLRNELYVSRNTDPQERQRMLELIDEKIEALPLPKVESYSIQSGSNGDVLVPRMAR